MHSFAIRVYYEDTDSGGVVYYANYLKFAERARTEALRQAGIAQSQLWDEQGIAFVVRRVEADFLSPAKLDDLLTITTAVEDIGGASITMKQTIQRDSQRLCTLDVRIGTVGRDFKAQRLPDAVATALRSFFTPTT